MGFPVLSGLYSVGCMVTLHIEHPITDYRTWRAAFDGFAQRRTDGGVRAARIAQPVDDQHYIVIDGVPNGRSACRRWTWVFVVFGVLEVMNVAVLYGAPGSRKGNGVGVFTAWEKSKADPEVHLLVRYLVCWVAGVKADPPASRALDESPEWTSGPGAGSTTCTRQCAPVLGPLPSAHPVRPPRLRCAGLGRSACRR